MSDIKYGAITRCDADCIEAVISRYDKPLRFLEVGVWMGETARGIKQFCDSRSIGLDYWAVDASTHESRQLPHGTHEVIMTSEEAWAEVPDQFDVAFIDGCHCINHVILDAIHYGQKILRGGIIMFHDTLPSQQHVMSNKWVHGDPEKPIHLTAVRDALCKIGWPNSNWNLIMDEFDPTANIGGIMAFLRC